MSRRNRHATSIASKAVELSLAVPQVVAHRVARMASAGPLPSQRDRREFQRMGAEKVTAFTQAWNAMAMQAVRANQALAATWMRTLWTPPWRAGKLPPSAAAQWQSAALGVIEKGIAPVHRTATANAKRLGRTKPR